MSTDKPGEPSGSVGPPNEPSSARDDDKTNWKPVYAAFAMAVALTLATVLWINRPGTESADPPPSPNTTASLAPPPTPNPDPRDAEITAAQEVYEKYSDAMLTMAKAGGSKEAVKEVRPFTMGPNWEAVKVQAEGLRRTGIKVTGKTNIVFNRTIATKANNEKPELSLRVCLDQRQLKARDTDGKRVNPIWIRSEVEMVQIENVWMIDNREDKVEDSSCVD